MSQMETETIQVILNYGKIISHLLKQADEQLDVHVSLNHVICQLYDNLKTFMLYMSFILIFIF